MATKLFQGGKGGTGSFTQTPDNLRSNDTFEGVLGLCLGPIKGPKNGLSSIKINGTPLENPDGTLNFQDFVAQYADGNPASFPQVVQLKLGQGASPTQVGTTLTNPNGAADTSSPGPWTVKTVPNQSPDFIDMRFIVSQLYKENSKGVYDETLTLEVALKPTGTNNWNNPLGTAATGTYNQQGMDLPLQLGLRLLLPKSYYQEDGTWGTPSPTAGFPISGKTTSPAVYQLRIAVPNTGNYANVTWDVRARLQERDHYDDGNGNTEYRTVSWDSVEAVYGNTMGAAPGWQGVSWLQLYGKASDQLTGVPTITGEYDTKVISVPPSSVWDPIARSYTGNVWDGSWAKSFTQDPAWIINDAISDPDGGIAYVAPGSYLNKWDALELSKWCSQLVPDGNGGMEPRYSINIAIQEQQKAEDFIRYLGGAVGALVWDQGDGQWRCKVDKPDTAVDLFTTETILGDFQYSHTDVDTRFNDIIVQFKNKEPGMDYRADAVRLFDSNSIAQIGRKPTTIVGVGCTGRQEALRRGMIRLRSAVNETKIVSFTTNRRGRNIDALSCILLADQDLNDPSQRSIGRMLALSADRQTITLRDPVYLAPGVAYTVSFAYPNPNYMPDTNVQPTSTDWKKPTIVGTFNVTNSGGSSNILTVDQPLPVTIADNANFALNAPGLPALPKLYRVTTVAYNDDGESVAINAIEVDTGKYDAADNVTNSATIFQDLRGVVPPPLLPDDGSAGIDVYSNVQKTIVNLALNWIRPSYAYVSGFQIKMSINGGALTTLVDNTQDTTYELNNPVTGYYHFEVSTIDRAGKISLPLILELDVTQALLDSAAIYLPAGLTMAGLISETNTALANAASALQGLATIASDNILSKGEKAQVIADVNVITAEKSVLDGQATALGVSTTAYDSAYTALITTYLPSLSPAWNDETQDTTIVGSTFRTNFTNYYTARTSMLNAMTANAAGRGDAAQIAANQALSQLLSIESDGVLSQGEKPAVVQIMNTIIAEKTPIDSEADQFAISRVSYDNAYNALLSYMNGLSPAYTDYTKNTTIASATFNSYFQSYYSARTALLNILTSAASNSNGFVNLIKMSRFEQGSNGGPWTTPAYNPANIGTDGGAFLYNGKWICKTNFTATKAYTADNTQQVSIEGSNKGIQQWSDVKPLDRMFASILIETANANCDTYVVFSDSLGNNQQSAYVGNFAPGSFPSANNADWNATNRIGLFFTVPAGMVKATFRVYGHANAAGGGFFSIAEPMLCSVPFTQTTYPSFTPGPNSTDGADITANNTAFDTSKVAGVASSTTQANITAAQSAATSAGQVAAIGAQLASDVADNNKFSSTEKKRWVEKINSLNGQVANLQNQANALGINHSSLDAQWAALNGYLSATVSGVPTSNTPPPNYLDTAHTSKIDSNTFKNYVYNFDNAVTALQSSFQEIASGRVASIASTTNLFTDPSFYAFTQGDGASNWQQILGWQGQVSPDGNRLYCPPNANSGNDAVAMGPNSKCGPNDRVDIEFEYFMSNPAPTSGNMGIVVQFYDQNGNYVTAGFVGISYTGPQNGWSNVYGSLVVNQLGGNNPGNICFCRAYLVANNMTSGGVYIRNPKAYRVPNALTNISANGRQNNALLTTAFAINASILTSGLTIGGDNQSIVISNFSMDFGNGYTSITGTTIGGLSASTAYYLYLLAPNMSDSGKSFSLSTSFASNTDRNRIYLGAFTTAAASGGTVSSGSGGSSGGGRVSSCIVETMYVHGGQAKNRRIGDPIEVMLEDWSGSELGRIKWLDRSLEHCFEITTAGGGVIECSETTPIELPDGSTVYPETCLGVPIAARLKDQFLIDRVAQVRYIGLRWVTKISVEGQTYIYAAGREPDMLVFTHNVQKP